MRIILFFFVCVCAELATEFLTIVDKSPSRLKKRIQDNIRMAVEVRGKEEREREGQRERDVVTYSLVEWTPPHFL